MIDRTKIYKDTEISAKAICLYFYLCDRVDREIKSCYPSIKTMSKDLNLSITSVKRAIDELIKYSYIAKKIVFVKMVVKVVIYIIFYKSDLKKDIFLNL